MSQDYRSQFVRAIEYGLAEVVPVEIIPSIINVVTSTLNDYEITERCTDIIVADDLNERLVKRYCACLMVDGKSEKTVYQYRRTIQKLSEFLEKRYTEMGAYDIRYFFGCRTAAGCFPEDMRKYQGKYIRILSMDGRRGAYSEKPGSVYQINQICG